MNELKRWYQYVNGEPAMCLAPQRDRQKKNAYVICLSAAHRYLDPPYMLGKVAQIIELFELGWSTTRMARIAAFIEDGFDQLVAMPPEPRESKVVGEGDAWMGSDKYSFDLYDTMIPGGTSGPTTH